MSWDAVRERLGPEELGAGGPHNFAQKQQLLQWQLILGPESDNYSRLLLDTLPACIPQAGICARVSRCGVWWPVRRYLPLYFSVFYLLSSSTF